MAILRYRNFFWSNYISITPIHAVETSYYGVSTIPVCQNLGILLQNLKKNLGILCNILKIPIFAHTLFIILTH